MLLRTYRLADRFGIVILKLTAGITDALLDRLHLFISTLRRGGGGLFGVLLRLLGVIGAVLLWILDKFRRVFGLVFKSSVRASGHTAGVARKSTADAMARRSARQEIDTEIIEDPLRAQNRVLSGLVVVVLVALIAVVLWATNSPSSSPTTQFVANTGPLSAGGSDTDTTPQALTNPNGELSTPVPTAIPLPDVLQVSGSFAFVKREMGQTDIWVAPVGSRTQIRITNSPADERDPAWSPDGRRLAYASNQHGNWEIYIYDLVTNETERMTFNLAFEARPQWSPDGTYLVYESYQRDSHLDIYVMPSDGSELPLRIASSNAPDFSPAWSPFPGRKIAFASWREGNRDIYIFDLDTQETINLTNTPHLHEDNPAWSPDGELVAYSAVQNGIETIFVKPASNPGAQAEVFRRGRTPAWSPDGTSIVHAVDSVDDTRIIVSPYIETGVPTEVIQVPKGSHSPVWTSAPLPPALVNSGGLELTITEPLFEEQVSSDGRPYGLGSLVNISGVESALLNELVNDSFNALRERTNELVGWDFLGQLSDAFWTLERLPQPGEPGRNWHMTGRAFSFNRNQILGFPPPVEIVREDSDLETFWRVYVRVADDAQNGELGEPLRDMPWDFVGPEDGDVEAYEQGGRVRAEMPRGYYVDVTQIAEDYGWLRVPASSDWLNNVNGRNYWMFQKREGLTWFEAMQQLYPDEELINFAPSPTPAPPVTSTPEAEDEEG